MSEILLALCSALLLALCLLGIRIARRIDRLHFHVHVSIYQPRRVDDDDDNDPSEAWKHN